LASAKAAALAEAKAIEQALAEAKAEEARKTRLKQQEDARKTRLFKKSGLPPDVFEEWYAQ
jgi:hypothetical protein